MGILHLYDKQMFRTRGKPAQIKGKIAVFVYPHALIAAVQPDICDVGARTDVQNDIFSGRERFGDGEFPAVPGMLPGPVIIVEHGIALMQSISTDKMLFPKAHQGSPGKRNPYVPVKPDMLRLIPVILNSGIVRIKLKFPGAVQLQEPAFPPVKQGVVVFFPRAGPCAFRKNDKGLLPQLPRDAGNFRAGKRIALRSGDQHMGAAGYVPYMKVPGFIRPCKKRIKSGNMHSRIRYRSLIRPVPDSTGQFSCRSKSFHAGPVQTGIPWRKPILPWQGLEQSPCIPLDFRDICLQTKPAVDFPTIGTPVSSQSQLYRKPGLPPRLCDDIPPGLRRHKGIPVLSAGGDAQFDMRLCSRKKHIVGKAAVSCIISHCRTGNSPVPSGKSTLDAADFLQKTTTQETISFVPSVMLRKCQDRIPHMLCSFRTRTGHIAENPVLRLQGLLRKMVRPNHTPYSPFVLSSFRPFVPLIKIMLLFRLCCYPAISDQSGPVKR